MRSVLHIDMNACASIECLYDPSIRNLPVAVGGDVEARRGIILAKNQIAKRGSNYKKPGAVTVFTPENYRDKA